MGVETEVRGHAAVSLNPGGGMRGAVDVPLTMQEIKRGVAIERKRGMRLNVQLNGFFRKASHF